MTVDFTTGWNMGVDDIVHRSGGSPTNPVPTTTGLNPASTPAGGLAFTLTVNGTNFIPTSVVRWGGTDRVTTFVSATELQADITAADIAGEGTAQVTVLDS